MKITYILKEGKPYLKLKYENDEWSKLEKLLKKLGLKKARTELGFAMYLRLEYYREEDTELHDYLKKHFESHLPSGLMDDINLPLYPPTNLAVFRVVPKRNSVVIKLDKYLTVADLNTLAEDLKELYSLLFNTVTEASIKFDVIE